MPAPVGPGLTDDRLRLDLDAVCRTCRCRHRLGLTLQDFTEEAWAWHTKHPGHDVEFTSPRRRIPPRFRDALYWLTGWAPWWLLERENADIKIEWSASSAITIGLHNSIASSSTFVTGRESASINNATTKYVDYRIAVQKITTGTTPTVDKE